MDLAAARQAILDGLAPLDAGSLAGRVYPYPPTVGRQSGPAIWIEQPDAELRPVGNNSNIVVSSFDVWAVVDGAADAQVAALDAAAAQIWAAMRAAAVGGAPVRPIGVTPNTVEVREGTQTYSRRASVVTVDVVVAAVSFCPPSTPEPVEIPPTLVSASVEE